MTAFYLDTSVAVHVLLGTGSAVRWFDAVEQDQHTRVVSSRLLRTELTRVLIRDRHPVGMRDDVLDFVEGVRLDEPILTAAESFSVHLKTLDAIHLASAIACGYDTVVVTHDANLKAAAEGLGFETLDPVVG